MAHVLIKIGMQKKITKENLWSNINSRVGHRKDKEKIGKVVFKV